MKNPAGGQMENIGQICGLRKKRQIGKTGRMSAANEIHHETVYFSGRVQGVGFRYTALQVAREFEVAGYVQNLVDGRVCVEAEGEEREVAGFIASIEERMAGYIRKVERAGARRAPQYSGFTVR